MNQIVLFFLAVSIIVLVVMPGSIGRRLLVAIGVFVVLCAALIAALLIGGDKPQPGARTVAPAELDGRQ
jgi:hypothetical protein